MKKFYLALCLVMMVFSGWGQLTHYEPFNYTPHATNGLHTQSSGVWIRLNTGDSILVTAGSLAYSGLQTSVGNKVNLEGTGSDNYTSFASQTQYILRF
jgi:hypothetical protein